MNTLEKLWVLGALFVLIGMFLAWHGFVRIEKILFFSGFTLWCIGVFFMTICVCEWC